MCHNSKFLETSPGTLVCCCKTSIKIRILVGSCPTQTWQRFKKIDFKIEITRTILLDGKSLTCTKMVGSQELFFSLTGETSQQNEKTCSIAIAKIFNANDSSMNGTHVIHMYSIQPKRHKLRHKKVL